MFKNHSNSRRLLTLVVLGGFLLLALASLDSSTNSVIGGFAIAVLGNCVSDAITASLNK